MSDHQWNAADYSQNNSAQFQWAMELMAKLKPAPGEHILDLGCGDGKATAAMASLEPRASFLGVDNSEAMIALAKNVHMTGPGRNYSFMLADARELPFENSFDAIFSNAALHWVKDHRPVLKGIAKALKPGGRLLLQMGGRGNAAEILEAAGRLIAAPRWRGYFKGFSFPYGFHGPEEYRFWLGEAGLTPRRVELFPKTMTHTREGLAGWIRTTWLPYLERLPQDLSTEFIEEVIAAFSLEKPPVGGNDYRVEMVRLEVEALKFDC